MAEIDVIGMETIGMKYVQVDELKTRKYQFEGDWYVLESCRLAFQDKDHPLVWCWNS